MAVRGNRTDSPGMTVRDCRLLLSRLLLINAVLTDPARCSPIRNQTDYPTCSQSLSAEASANIPHVVTALLAPESMSRISPAKIYISNGNLKHAILFST